jgi:hypothetical protein
MVRTLCGEHHGDTSDFNHTRVKSADCLLLDDLHAFHTKMLANAPRANSLPRCMRFAMSLRLCPMKRDRAGQLALRRILHPDLGWLQHGFDGGPMF